MLIVSDPIDRHMTGLGTDGAISLRWLNTVLTVSG